MSPSDYGIVAMFTVLVNFVSPFTGLSIHGAIQRQYYERDNVDLSIYVTNCLFILIFSSALVYLTFSLFALPISRLSYFPEDWLWVVIAVSISQFITRVNLSLWQVQFKARTYGFYQVAQTVLNIGLSVWFVVFLRMAWQGRIQAQFLAITSFGLLGLFLLYKDGWIKFAFNKTYIRNALSFGVPLVPHALGGVMMTMTDRFFITNMVGLSATGLYSVGYQIGMVVGLLATSFNQAYVPWLFHKLKNNNDDDTKIVIVKITYAYFVLIILVSTSLSLIAPWFLSVFVGKDFSGASVFVFWIATGYAFSGMYMMIVNYIFYVQKTYILAWITFSSALLNIVFNYVFIKLNGSVGAAQAASLTFLLSFLLTWILSNRVYRMPWFSFLDRRSAY
jgi:O-antigen/teichoic acid export membrane protein